jgi:hypothetical protein
MTLIDETARGVYVIAPTPFTEEGAMDWPSTDRLMDFYLDSASPGVFRSSSASAVRASSCLATSPAERWISTLPASWSRR